MGEFPPKSFSYSKLEFYSFIGQTSVKHIDCASVQLIKLLNAVIIYANLTCLLS